MKRFAVFVAMSLLASLTFGQENGSKVATSSLLQLNKAYRITIEPYGANAKRIKGYLLNVDSSSLWITTEKNRYGYRGGNNIPYTALGKVSIVPKGKQGRSILFGSIAGFVVGGAVGAGIGSGQKGMFGGAGFGAFAGALSGAMVGVVIGALVGIDEHRFILRGKKENYAAMRRSLLLE
ncbi:hypothetical protein [Flavisolibacter ginsenosidimutans]|uniref:Glycine zipper domain-containing protein n=1 Tax=Flavisolibacter ginsenosidimutans TaxID=661481 RepID=A0A5B8UF48_9BACT|nr:hypothetical protein [Flavisolibacter ginsenosidimutans]QEC55291.1 hypothetical protein FSB75_05015 [Flavisolibacter ginsenosidimutans]